MVDPLLKKKPLSAYEGLKGMVQSDVAIEEPITQTQSPVSKYAGLDAVYQNTVEREKQGIVDNRSMLGEIATSIPRGIFEAGEMGLRALRLGQDKPGEDVGLIDKLATKGLSAMEEYKAESPTLQPKYSGGVKGAISEGVTAVGTSLTAGLPGMAAGAAAASFIPVVGTAMGAILGYALSAGGIFGAAQYDDVLERADAQGISRDESESAAVWSGIHEAGWEFASDMVGAKLLGITGKALAPVAKETLKQGISGLFKTGLKQTLKQMGKVSVVETGSEMITEGFQSDIEKGIGLGDTTFWDGAKQAFGPSFVASVIFGGLGVGGAKLRRNSIEKALVNPDADIEKRLTAAKQVKDTLKDIDGDIADVWFDNAVETISAGEPISMDSDVVAGSPISTIQEKERIISNLETLPKRTPEQETKLSTLKQEVEELQRHPDVKAEQKATRDQKKADLEKKKTNLEKTAEVSPKAKANLERVNQELIALESDQFGEFLEEDSRVAFAPPDLRTDFTPRDPEVKDITPPKVQVDMGPSDILPIGWEDTVLQREDQKADQPIVGEGEGLDMTAQAEETELIERRGNLSRVMQSIHDKRDTLDEEMDWVTSEQKIKLEREIQNINSKLSAFSQKKKLTKKDQESIGILESRMEELVPSKKPATPQEINDQRISLTEALDAELQDIPETGKAWGELQEKETADTEPLPGKTDDGTRDGAGNPNISKDEFKKTIDSQEHKEDGKLNKYLFTQDTPENISNILNGKSGHPRNLVYWQEGRLHHGNPDKSIIVIDKTKIDPSKLTTERDGVGEYLVNAKDIHDAVVGSYKNSFELADKGYSDLTSKDSLNTPKTKTTEQPTATTQEPTVATDSKGAIKSEIVKKPEQIATRINEINPEHEIKYDGEFDRTALKKGPLYQFTPQSGPLKGRTIAVEDLSVYAVGKKIAIMEREKPSEAKISTEAKVEKPKQTKEEKIAAIDKFFGRLSPKAIQKKIFDLKEGRKQYKEDPEFLKQIDDRIAELEKQLLSKKKEPKFSTTDDIAPLSLKEIKKKWNKKASTLFLSEDGKIVRVGSIIIPKGQRKTGVGSDIMNDVIRYADSVGKRVELTPGTKDDRHGTTSRSRLVKFYKKFGFVENKGRNKDFEIGAGKMYREPGAKLSTTQDLTGAKTPLADSGKSISTLAAFIKAIEKAGEDVSYKEGLRLISPPGEAKDTLSSLSAFEKLLTTKTDASSYEALWKILYPSEEHGGVVEHIPVSNKPAYHYTSKEWAIERKKRHQGFRDAPKNKQSPRKFREKYLPRHENSVINAYISGKIIPEKVLNDFGLPAIVKQEIPENKIVFLVKKEELKSKEFLSNIPEIISALNAIKGYYLADKNKLKVSGIYYKAKEKIMGLIPFASEKTKTEIDYYFTKAYTGKGYDFGAPIGSASEMQKIIDSFIKDPYAVTRIEGWVTPKDWKKIIKNEYGFEIVVKANEKAREIIKNINYKKTPEGRREDFKTIKGKFPSPNQSSTPAKGVQYSLDQLPGQGVTLQEIQQAFPGQQVFLSPDNSISVRYKNGKGVRIISTNDMGKGDIQFAIESGRMDGQGLILGKAVGNTITLNKDYADQNTLFHEIEHTLENSGVITKAEKKILNNFINRLVLQGRSKYKLNKSVDPDLSASENRKIQLSENRANAFSQLLSDRKKYRGTKIGKILQKVRDFLDGLLYVGRASARKLAREVESGKIFSRKVNGKQIKSTVEQYEKAAAVWYSKMREIISQKINNAPAPIMLSQVKSWAKKGMFKQEELEWSGLTEFLDGKKGKVTKQEVLDYLDQNQVVIEDVVKGHVAQGTEWVYGALSYGQDELTEYDKEYGGFEDAKAAAEEVAEKQRDYWLNDSSFSYEIMEEENESGDIIYSFVDLSEELREFDNYKEAKAEWDEEIEWIENESVSISIDEESIAVQTSEGDELFQATLEVGRDKSIDAAKFSEYQLPGGKYYKEILLTLPGLDQEFTSIHFEEPNILAHVRMSEREVDGKKVLHLEEVQSDWHQAGRKKGYKGNITEEKIIEKAREMFDEENTDGRQSWAGSSPVYYKKAKRFLEGGVPDAPFKKTWALLAMKRMARYAAENGFDTIAWTTGELQAERYDLSKRVSEIAYYGTTLTAKNLQGKEIIYEKFVSENDLEDYIGKEASEKLLNQPIGEHDGELSVTENAWGKYHVRDILGNSLEKFDSRDKANTWVAKNSTTRILSGLDLKVGGTGMAGFYDKILPAEVKKFFGKKAWGKPEIGTIEIEADGKKELWSLEITPEMKSKALREGMPLFQTIPQADIRYQTTEDLKVVLERTNTTDQTAEQGDSKYQGSAENGQSTIEGILNNLRKTPETKINIIKEQKIIEEYRKLETLAKDSQASVSSKQKMLAQFLKVIPVKVRSKVITPLTFISRFKQIKTHEKRIDEALLRTEKELELYLRRDIIDGIVKGIKPKKLAGNRIKKDTIGHKAARDLQFIREVLREKDINTRMSKIESELTTKEAELEEVESEIIEEEILDLQSHRNIIETFGNLKSQSLEDLLFAKEALSSIIVRGRALWRLQQDAFKEAIDPMVTKVQQDISGQTDPTLETSAEATKRMVEKESTWGKAKGTWDAVDNSILSWEFLMNKLSKLSGSKILQSYTTTGMGSVVQSATKQENIYNIETDDLIHSSAKKIFNAETDNVLNKKFMDQEVKQAGKVFSYDEAGKKVDDFAISQMEAAYMYAVRKNDDSLPTFGKMGMTEKTFKDIEAFIGPELKAWVDYNVDEYLQDYHFGVNQVYRQVYGTNLTKTPGYISWYRDVPGKVQEKGISANPHETGASGMSKGSFKERQKNTNPYRFMSFNDVLTRHVSEMNNFKAWAMPTKIINGVLNNRKTQRLIVQHHSVNMRTAIKSFQADFIKSPLEMRGEMAWLDKMRGNITTAMTALNPTIFLKQLTSIPAMAESIPAKEWIKHSVDFWKNPVKAWRLLKDSKHWESRRTKGMERDIRTAQAVSGSQAVANVRNLKNRAMFLVKWGDSAAILVGGYPVYKHHFDNTVVEMGRKKAHEFALSKFETAMDRTQQASGIKDQGKFQRSGSYAKLFSMFLTAPKQYTSQITAAIRQIHSDPKDRDAYKRLFIFGVMMPSLFQATATGLLGLIGGDEEDEKKFISNQIKAILQSPLNGIPIIRDLQKGVWESAMGEWYGTDVEYSPVTEAGQSLLNAVFHGAKLLSEEDPDKRGKRLEQTLNNVFETVGYAYGLPANTVRKMFMENWSDIVTGETDYPFRRGIGFSRYAMGEHGSRYNRTMKRIEKLKKEFKDNPKDWSTIRKDKYYPLIKHADIVKRKIVKLNKTLRMTKSKIATQRIEKRIKSLQEQFNQKTKRL